MSTSFPNMPTDSALPEIGMYNPDPNTPSQEAGGKTKIRPSADAPHPTEQEGYGYMTSDAKMKIEGMAPSGENSSGIPAAQPIEPITFGDVNNTNEDVALDSFRRGF